MADLTVTANSVALDSGQFQTGTAGVSITAGQSVYMDASDSNKIKLADADFLASSRAVGIALNPAASGQKVSYALPDSIVSIGATVAVGTSYYVSPTAGGICVEGDLQSGDFPFLLAVATAAGKLKLIGNALGDVAKA